MIIHALSQITNLHMKVKIIVFQIHDSISAAILCNMFLWELWVYWVSYLTALDNSFYYCLFIVHICHWMQNLFNCLFSWNLFDTSDMFKYALDFLKQKQNSEMKFCMNSLLLKITELLFINACSQAIRFYFCFCLQYEK